MIVTYKIRHDEDFSQQLDRARQIATYVITHPLQNITIQHVKHFGLKTILAKQLIKKYNNNRTVKQVHNVNVIVPGKAIKVDRARSMITIPSLNYSFKYNISNSFLRICNIEINSRFLLLSIIVPVNTTRPKRIMGVDLNTTGHVAVYAIPSTGKVVKMGKYIPHMAKKYRNISKSYLKKGNVAMARKMERKRNRILRNMTHEISRSLVAHAKKSKSAICLERFNRKKNKRVSKRELYSLYNWIFFHMERQILYKSKLLGVKVVRVDPHKTSKICNKCGHTGFRRQKRFECPYCGHIEHADVNAAFNIALRHERNARSYVERGACEGNTGVPDNNLVLTQPILKASV